MSGPADSLAAALVDGLDDVALAHLAERLQPYLPEPETDADGYLDVDGAASFLACPKSRVYALVSAGRLPVHRDGSRLLFDRQELRAWVRNGGGKRP